MESGAMAMLGATGGLLIMVYYLLMLVLSILVPFFVWRIWKWSYATSQELKQLNEKFDRLISLQGATAPTGQPEGLAATGLAAWETTEAEDEAGEPEPTASEDPLSAAFEADTNPAANATTEDQLDTTETLVGGSDVADLVEEPAKQDTAEKEETGFEFAVSPEEAFGGEEAEEAPVEEGGFDFSATTDEEESDAFAAEAGEESFPTDDNAFDFDAQEDADADNLDQEFDSVFGAGEEDAQEPAAGEQDPFAAFDSAPATEQPHATDETPAGEEQADLPSEEESGATSAEQSTAEEQVTEPTEQRPAIIPLDSDPQRPTVKLARCGSCDHKLAYKEPLSGKKARCPSCQSAFILP